MCGLRNSIDEGAEEIGKEIAAELPANQSELQKELPDDIQKLSEDFPENSDGKTSYPSDLLIRKVLAESPLNECFDNDDSARDSAK